MSDFFYKERLGAAFSPVIKVKQEKVSGAVVSALDNLLSPSGNIFTRAETVKNLMKIEKLDLEKTARALSLRKTDVANKLRLLEFSPKERQAILEFGFSETAALQFLRLDKISRLYVMEYCNKSRFSDSEIAGHIDSIINSRNEAKTQIKEKTEKVRKFVVNDIGFFFNSIENALRIAKNAGFEVEDKRSENEEGYDIHISVRKKGRTLREVDKNGANEYNE